MANTYSNRWGAQPAGKYPLTPGKKSNGWELPDAQTVLQIQSKYGTPGGENNSSSFPAANPAMQPPKWGAPPAQAPEYGGPTVPSRQDVLDMEQAGLPEQMGPPIPTGDAWQSGKLQPVDDWAGKGLNQNLKAADRWSGGSEQSQRYYDRKFGRTSSDPMQRMASRTINAAATPAARNYTPAPVRFNRTEANWSPY